MGHRCGWRCPHSHHFNSSVLSHHGLQATGSATKTTSHRHRAVTAAAPPPEDNG